MRVEALVGVSLANLERPLADVDDLVAQTAELDVLIRALVLLNRILSELSIHIEPAITKEHHWDVLSHEQPHGSLILRREVLLPVGPSLNEQLDQCSELLFLKEECGRHLLSLIHI